MNIQHKIHIDETVQEPSDNHQCQEQSGEQSVDTLLAQGVTAWEEGRGQDAYLLFKECYRREPKNCKAMSYVGLLETLVRHNNQLGCELAQEAARLAPHDVVVHLNLGLTLIDTYDKYRGVPAIRRALQLDPECEAAKAIFADLGIRRQPPIPFLPRSNIFNVLIGKLIYKIKGPKRLT